MKSKAQKTEKKKISTFVCAPGREGNRVGREKSEKRKKTKKNRNPRPNGLTLIRPSETFRFSVDPRVSLPYIASCALIDQSRRFPRLTAHVSRTHDRERTEIPNVHRKILEGAFKIGVKQLYGQYSTYTKEKKN